MNEEGIESCTYLMELLNSTEISKLHSAEDYWDCLLDFLDEKWKSIPNAAVFRNCHKFLLTRLIEFRCSDKRIVSRIVKLYWHISILSPEMQDSSMREAISNFVQLSLEGNAYVFAVQRLHFCVENADLNLMKVLVMYGMSEAFHVISYYEFKRAEDSLLQFWKDSQVYEFGSFGYLNRQARFILKQLLCELRCKCSTWDSTGKQSGFVRIILIIWILKAITLSWKRDPSLDDYVRCVRLYFRTIPEPFISRNEVQNFLRCLFCYARCVEGVKRMTKLYEKLFSPESSIPYRPRTLKHLCRCFIRKNLIGHSKLLPDTVLTLDIPVALKDYLLGDLKFGP